MVLQHNHLCFAVEALETPIDVPHIDLLLMNKGATQPHLAFQMGQTLRCLRKIGQAPPTSACRSFAEDKLFRSPASQRDDDGGLDVSKKPLP